MKKNARRLNVNLINHGGYPGFLPIATNHINNSDVINYIELNEDDQYGNFAASMKNIDIFIQYNATGQYGKVDSMYKLSINEYIDLIEKGFIKDKVSVARGRRILNKNFQLSILDNIQIKDGDGNVYYLNMLNHVMIEKNTNGLQMRGIISQFGELGRFFNTYDDNHAIIKIIGGARSRQQLVISRQFYNNYIANINNRLLPLLIAKICYDDNYKSDTKKDGKTEQLNIILEDDNLGLEEKLIRIDAVNNDRGYNDIVETNKLSSTGILDNENNYKFLRNLFESDDFYSVSAFCENIVAEFRFIAFNNVTPGNRVVGLPRECVEIDKDLEGDIFKVTPSTIDKNPKWHTEKELMDIFDNDYNISPKEFENLLTSLSMLLGINDDLYLNVDIYIYEVDDGRYRIGVFEFQQEGEYPGLTPSIVKKINENLDSSYIDMYSTLK